MKELGMKISDEDGINCEILEEEEEEEEEGKEESEHESIQNNETVQDSKNDEELDDNFKSDEEKIEVQENELENQILNDGSGKEESQNDLGANNDIENESRSEKKFNVEVDETTNAVNEDKVELATENLPKLKETIEVKEKKILRPLTEPFLAPDPIPVPPHVLVCFDAYKRKEIMDLIEQHVEAVLAYGYFTSDDLTTATLIANSTFKYNLETPTIHDKFFVKLAKKVGTALASFIEMSPCHVSENTEIGCEECLLLFPSGYKNASETGIEPKEPDEEIVSKKKKRKKNKKNKEEGKEEETREVETGEGVEDDGDDDDEDDESELEEDNIQDSND